MQILMVSITGIFLASTWLTQSSFRQLWLRERTQVAVDNAAIVLGRAVEEMLHSMEETNSELRILDIEHHELHFCARNIFTALECFPMDKAMEVEISLLSSSANVELSLLWQKAASKANMEASLLRNLIEVVRLPVPPIHLVKCLICGSPHHFSFDQKRAITWIHAISAGNSSEGVKIQWSKESGKWLYRLSTEIEAEE